jgi:uncharacterized protein (TIGR03000 family)
MYSVVLMMAMTGGGDMPAGLFHKDSGCCGGGCYGSCYGCSGGGHHGGRSRGHGHKGGGCCGGGCYGGCYGCCGGYAYGCCGGGCHGCYGGGCHGCCGGGCYGCCGGGCIGGPVAPVPPTTPPPTPKKTSLDSAAPATIVVNVPADARLTIDGEATTSTSTQRVFVSPAINPGREYHYTLKAEFQKDGKMVSVSKNIAV